jgi:formylglycine-generating enzyme required for sulfatase activity
MANIWPKAAMGVAGAIVVSVSILVVTFFISTPGSTHIAHDYVQRVRTNPRDGLPYVWIPPGKFTMGCLPEDLSARARPGDPYSKCWPQEKPAHQVTITGGFWLGQTVVMRATYQRVVGADPDDNDSEGANRPVRVTWGEAQSYCQAVGGRLPTEAEWEYAARAGSVRGYDDRTPSQIAQKRPNAFGMYVRETYVSEWTADWYGNYAPDSVVNPEGPASGQRRAVRSSGFGKYREDNRLSYRYGVVSTGRYSRNGFRCVGGQGG